MCPGSGSDGGRASLVMGKSPGITTPFMPSSLLGPESQALFGANAKGLTDMCNELPRQEFVLTKMGLRGG